MSSSWKTFLLSFLFRNSYDLQFTLRPFLRKLSAAVPLENSILSSSSSPPPTPSTPSHPLNHLDQSPSPDISHSYLRVSINLKYLQYLLFHSFSINPILHSPSFTPSSNQTAKMHLNTMSQVLLAFAFMITSVLTAALSNPVARTINNNGGAVFKGDYGGHAYELNGTVHVSRHLI